MRKMILAAIAALTIGAAAMADYYVTKLGNDTTGNGSEALPWLTIQKAVDTVPDGTHTIKIGAGTYAEGTRLSLANLNAANNHITFESLSGERDVIVTGTSSCLYGYTVWATGVVFRFDGIEFGGDPSTYTMYFLELAGAGTNRLVLDFNNCKITRAGASASATVFYYRGIASATFVNTDILQKAAHAGTTIDMITGTGTCSFTGGKLATGTGALFAFPSATAPPAMTFDGVEFDFSSLGTPYNGFYCGVIASAAAYFRVTNCTVTGRYGVYIDRGFTEVTVSDTTINATLVSGEATCLLAAGANASTAYTPPVTTVYFRNNTVTHLGDYQQHGLLVGKGVIAGEVSGNVVTGGDFVAVFKSDDVLIERNIFASVAGKTPECTDVVAFAGGASGNTFQYNTIYAPDGQGLDHREQVGVKPSDNTVQHNIIMTASGNADFVHGESGDGQADTCLVRHNLYHSGGGGPVLSLTVQGTGDTLSEIQALWAAYGGVGADNDATSEITNPHFTDPDNGDFTTPYSRRGYGYYAGGGDSGKITAGFIGL